VAIITDGNSRWARARGVSVNEGHNAGADTVKAAWRDAAELGVRELTVYSFSTENWSRPPEEVQGPDGDVLRAHRRGDAGAARRGRAHALHREQSAPAQSRLSIVDARGWTWAEAMTEKQRAHLAVRGVDYGGRAEILDAARRFQGSTEEEFRSCLYAPEMHDPDLIIRTSGEQRLSNYLLWQSAYSELIFRQELWPEFTREGLRGVASRVSPPAPSLRWAIKRSLMALRARTPAGQARARRRGEPREAPSDLRARLLAAVPAIAVALFLVIEGGLIFTLGLFVLGCVCMHELYAMYARAQPVRLAGFLGLAGLLAAALYGSQYQVLPRRRGRVARALRADPDAAAAERGGMSLTLLGIYWIGLALAHAVLLRRLPHGLGIVIDVLGARFLGDTGAYLGGRLFAAARSRRESPWQDRRGPRHRHGLLRAGRGGSPAATRTGCPHPMRSCSGSAWRSSPRSAICSSPSSAPGQHQGLRRPVRGPRRRARRARRGALQRGRELLQSGRRMCN